MIEMVNTVASEPRRATVKEEMAELSGVIERVNQLSERVWRGICCGEAPNTNPKEPVDLPTALGNMRERLGITMIRLETIIDILGVE